MCISIYIYLYMHRYIYIYTYLHTYIYIYIYVHTYIYIYIATYIYIYIYIKHIDTHTHILLCLVLYPLFVGLCVPWSPGLLVGRRNPFSIPLDTPEMRLKDSWGPSQGGDLRWVVGILMVNGIVRLTYWDIFV